MYSAHFLEREKQKIIRIAYLKLGGSTISLRIFCYPYLMLCRLFSDIGCPFAEKIDYRGQLIRDYRESLEFFSRFKGYDFLY